MSEPDGFVVAPDDACLDGHFPDAPIVPGVVLLDQVITAAERRFGVPIEGLTRCKFVAALYPNQRCEIALGAPHESRLRFSCSGPQGLVAEGVLRCGRN